MYYVYYMYVYIYFIYIKHITSLIRMVVVLNKWAITS